MKIYIAGKITGDPDYVDKFFNAACELEEQGHVVLNPSALPDGLSQGEYMRICLAMLDCADTAYFLPDWRESAGARVEMDYCVKVGKAVMFG